MSTKPAANDAAITFDAYWKAVNEEVSALSQDGVDLEEIKIRSNESSTVYAARFNGIGGYPLFAYYSLPDALEWPKGNAPFPALFEVPGYGSVRGVPAVERRAKYAVMGVCHRGQRLSDGKYKAAYPGLLTEGLPGAGSYRWREIVADCLRAIDVLLARPEVDKGGVGVAGNDLAAIVAAMRPQTNCVLLNGQLLFRGTPGALGSADAYPLQEFNDFRRAYPGQWEQAAETLSLYDPLRFAPGVRAETLVACIKADAGPAGPFAASTKGKCEIRINSGYGYLDHEFQEEWLARRLLGGR
jgi:cephalosporin-C deacetylase